MVLEFGMELSQDNDSRIPRFSVRNSQQVSMFHRYYKMDTIIDTMHAPIYQPNIVKFLQKWKNEGKKNSQRLTCN